MTLRRWTTSIAVCMAASTVLADDSTWRWIEAEDAVASNMTLRHPFAPASDQERALLSGGKWIGAAEKRSATLFAVYDVDVPADGRYQLFARKFWKHGPYRVSFNNGPWTTIGDDVALLDAAELRTHVVANWTPAGSFELKAGRNRFRIESTKNEGAIAFDCFVLTSEGFVARGTLKPDEQLASKTPGFFAWDSSSDVKDSPIDLRFLNEEIAGEEGFITTHGEQFILPTSKKPTRFWGVNVGPDTARLPDAQLDQFASMLASRGVNLIRLHGAFYATEGADVGKVDDAQLENIRRAVAAFKRHGIYSTLSIYFPVWVKLEARHGWSGYDKKNPFGLLFIDAKFQAVYRAWWTQLLTRTSEAHPVALKDEPAVLSLEMQNEDSLFFWTFTPYRTIPAPTIEQFERSFAAWLATKYGTADAALSKWNAEKLPGDEPRNGRVGLGEPWRWFNKRDARSKDTVAFLFDTQRSFYTSTRDFLRNEIGTKSLISASNWTTASEQYLTPLERASNLVGDFIDRHGYYNGVHEGPRAGWMVSEGDTYSDRSALRFDPEKPGEKPASWNPILDTTYNDKPTMVSEIDWIEPNAFRAEMPLLCAAYGSQQDLDAIAFFAAGGAGWQPTISKFALMTPAALAQYPAAALIYRLGLVDPSLPVADASIALNDLLDLQGGLTGVDGKSRLVGRLKLRVDDTPTARPSVDLSRHIDDSRQSVTSNTGQLTLDHKNGVLTVNAPAAKSLVGFLDKAGDASLGDVSIQSAMPYGAIAVVALDGKPIADSSTLLVQIMSQQQNEGWKTDGGTTKKITSFGTLPMLVRDFSGTITIAGDRKWNAQRIGPNLKTLAEPMPIGNTLTLDASTPYYLLTPTGD